MKTKIVTFVLSSAIGVVFAKAAPAPKESYDSDLFRKDKKVIFANAEFLYWTVNEATLDYAVKMKDPAWGPTSDAVGHYETAEFEWNPGFRVNLGYFNAPHYWDACVQYTYFKGTGHDEADQPTEAGRFLNGTWPHPSPIAQTALDKAHSDIDLWYNLFEFLFSRRFHPNPHLRMRLLGGLTFAWLRQNWEIDYRDLNNFKSHLHNHWRFTGTGLRLGLMLDWFLGKGGFYFTGLTSVACYAGSYHNVSKQTSTFSNADYNNAFPLRNAHYRDTRLVPQFQFAAGPSWQKTFTKYRTELFLGYEFNLWANLHEILRSFSNAPQGAKQSIMNNGLTGIQGVTFRANLDF